jgi:hypothetical protein
MLRRRCLRRWLRSCGGLVAGHGLDNLLEDIRIDQVEEQQRLEESVCQLWRLRQEFDGPGCVCHDQALHLGEDIEQLRGR